jgi:hypothetical protein
MNLKFISDSKNISTGLSREAIENGRLRKKIVKLKQQLANREAENKRLNTVLGYYPYAQKTYDDIQMQRANRQRLADLTGRVKEQALLIEQLNKEK